MPSLTSNAPRRQKGDFFPSPDNNKKSITTTTTTTTQAKPARGISNSSRRPSSNTSTTARRPSNATTEVEKTQSQNHVDANNNHNNTNSSRSRSISHISTVNGEEGEKKQQQQQQQYIPEISEIHRPTNSSNNNNSSNVDLQQEQELSPREIMIVRAAVQSPFHKAHASFGTGPRFVPVTLDGYTGHDHSEPYPGPGEYEVEKYPSLQRQVEEGSKIRQEQSFMDQSYQQAKEEDEERKKQNKSQNASAISNNNNVNNVSSVSIVAANFPSLLSPFHKSHTTFGTGPRFVPVTIDGFSGHEHRPPFPGPGEYRLPSAAPTLVEGIEKEQRVRQEQVGMDTSYHQAQEVEQHEKEKSAARNRESVNNSVVVHQSPRNAAILRAAANRSTSSSVGGVHNNANNNNNSSTTFKRQDSNNNNSKNNVARSSSNASRQQQVRGGAIGRSERFTSPSAVRASSVNSQSNTPMRQGTPTRSVNNNNTSTSSPALGRHSESNANKPRDVEQHRLPITAEQRKAYIKQIIDGYKTTQNQPGTASTASNSRYGSNLTSPLATTRPARNGSNNNNNINHSSFEDGGEMYQQQHEPHTEREYINSNGYNDEKNQNISNNKVPPMLPNFTNNNTNSSSGGGGKMSTPRANTTKHELRVVSPSPQKQQQNVNSSSRSFGNNNNRSASSSTRHDTLSSVLRRSSSQVAREIPANYKEQSAFEKSFEQNHQVRVRNASPMYRRQAQQEPLQRSSSNGSMATTTARSQSPSTNNNLPKPITIAKTKRQFTQGGNPQSSEYQNLDAFFANWLKNAKQSGTYQSPHQ